MWEWIGLTLAPTAGNNIGKVLQKKGTIILPPLSFKLKVLLNGWLRICRSKRRDQELMECEVIEEIIYGLESGMLFGMASVISKMGFVFLEQDFPRMLAPVRISIIICCSGTAFYYQTQGLKHGRAIVVSTCAAVASIVTGVLAGMLALGERLPSAPSARLSLLLGWLLILTGVTLLVSSSRLVRYLPWRFRHFVHSGVNKNFNTRQSGSTFGKESSPSAVIPTTT